MFSRVWWFIGGLIVGAMVVMRALDRRPQPTDLGHAAVRTGADLLDLIARVVRPKHT